MSDHDQVGGPNVRSYFNRPDSGVGAVSFMGVRDLTDQAFKDQCDINKIVQHFEDSGMWPVPGKQAPTLGYDAFDDHPTLQDQLQLVIDTKERFSALPVAVRRRFGNDPEALVSFVTDARNRDQAVALGLIPAAPVGAASSSGPVPDSSRGGKNGNPD